MNSEEFKTAFAKIFGQFDAILSVTTGERHAITVVVSLAGEDVIMAFTNTQPGTALSMLEESAQAMRKEGTTPDSVHNDKELH